MGNVLMNSTLALRLNYDISQIIKPVVVLKQFHETRKIGSQQNQARNGMGVLENNRIIKLFLIPTLGKSLK